MPSIHIILIAPSILPYLSLDVYFPLSLCIYIYKYVSIYPSLSIHLSLSLSLFLCLFFLFFPVSLSGCLSLYLSLSISIYILVSLSPYLFIILSLPLSHFLSLFSLAIFPRNLLYLKWKRTKKKKMGPRRVLGISDLVRQGNSKTKTMKG